jgi:hypothetical protein
MNSRKMLHELFQGMNKEAEDLTPAPQFKELLEIYTKQIEALKEEEVDQLCYMQVQMRQYMKVVDARQDVEVKLSKLKYKMGFAAHTEKKEEVCDNS